MTANYLSLPARGQKLWRNQMYRTMLDTFLHAVQHLEYEGTLCEWVQHGLHTMEMEQEFETCAGIRDMIDEYSEQLHC